MRRAALVASLLVAAWLAPPAAAGATSPVSVGIDRTRISTELGRTFTFHTTIANHGRAPAAGLIAHLNVLSLRNGVYVDPEDWSSNRTRYLPPIPARGRVTLGWRLQAVNSGSIGVYVALLSKSGVARPPITGPAVHVVIAERRTLDAGGVLPLVLGVPAFLGALSLGVRARRRAS